MTKQKLQPDGSVICYYRLPPSVKEALDAEADNQERSASKMLKIILCERYGISAKPSKNGKSKSNGR